MRITKLLQDLWANERTGGIVLIACTVASLLLANSFMHEAYVALWHVHIVGHPLEFWINDGLMTVFFLMIGLELEREVYVGELSNGRQALLPVIAALGGMLVPAGLYFLLNKGTATASGAGIPMATDIAFAIGILSLLGSRVPTSLKVFLTALAVIDDLGAVLTIAIFYAHDLSWIYLAAALGVFAVMLVLNRLRVMMLIPYLLLGIIMWYCMLRSGVHATITGVLLAFAIPFGDGGERTISYRLQRFLHKPVAFVIMPLFALANTCIILAPGWIAALGSLHATGIALGLVIGKPIGIVLFSLAAIACGWCALPEGMDRKQLMGVGMLGGIGFTMSIFISLLAFNDAIIIAEAKTAILLSSLVAGVLGTIALHMVLPRVRRSAT